MSNLKAASTAKDKTDDEVIRYKLQAKIKEDGQWEEKGKFSTE